MLSTPGVTVSEYIYKSHQSVQAISPGPWMGNGLWPGKNWAPQQEVSGSTSCLPDHPTPVHGKSVFHETSSWCPKGWGPLL